MGKPLLAGKQTICAVPGVDLVANGAVGVGVRPAAQPSLQIVRQVPDEKAGVSLGSPLADVHHLVDHERRQVRPGPGKDARAHVHDVGEGDGRGMAECGPLEPRPCLPDEQPLRVDAGRQFGNCRRVDPSGFERFGRREIVAHVEWSAHPAGNVAVGRLADVDVRIVDEGDIEQVFGVLGHAFGFDPKPEHLEHFAGELELDRLVGAFESGTLVGTGGAYSFRLTVPDGTVGCGGTTVIAVLPSPRRRGVLTAMMAFHLDEVAGRGEPVAALWASESSIYGRFGYGVASRVVRSKADTSRLSFPRPPLGTGSVRIIDETEARSALPPLYERIRPTRPGFLSRSESRWGAHFYDPPDWRDGGTPLRWALYEEDGDAHGYAVYRQHENWEDGVAANRLSCSSVMAATGAAEDGLWRFLAGIDLVRDLDCANTDPDSILPHIVADSRRVQRASSDGMWVRILDVPAALTARRYQVPGRIVLQVEDPFRESAAGTFALEGSPEGATCRPVSDTPDLRLDVRHLSAVYLGAGRLSQLARAGLVEGSPQALSVADLMFGWPVTPWCPEVF